jgi:methionyl-tRNA formyltransferase
MQMEAGLDTGPMLLSDNVLIDRKNAAQLTEELAKLGAELMVRYLASPGDYRPHTQPSDGVTHAAKIRKEEARIDWSRPASEIARQVQGLAPFPGAWFEVAGERIKILEAVSGDPGGEPGLVLDDCLNVACGTGHLRPLKVQRAGKAPMNVGELLRGFPIPKGTVLP